MYDLVTSKILALIEQGTVPWRAGWTCSPVGAPLSVSTTNTYRGINRFLLGTLAQVVGYTSPWWLTFRQARELGGAVRRGEHGAPCIFWRILDGAQADQEPTAGEGDAPDERQDETAASPGRKRFVLRYYTVFNVQQCEGLPAHLVAAPLEPPRLACTDLIACYRSSPAVEHGFNRAYYSPSHDRVRIPAPEAFTTPEEYYSTLFHELVHSTGHPSRLGRLSGNGDLAPFGSPDYSREELVAEMGAALLCAATGISSTVIENQAAYVAGWLKVLREDSKALVIAAAQAQRAADLILGGPATAA